MNAKEALAPEAFAEYQDRWAKFQEKEKLEHKFYLHSSAPVIGKPMIYLVKKHGEQDQQKQIVSRAKVFQEKLKKIDPYEKHLEYRNSIWHLEHYIRTYEQLWHATLAKIRELSELDNSKLATREIIDEGPGSMKMKDSISFNRPVSIELIIEMLAKSTKRFIFVENAYFNYYRGNEEYPVAGIICKTFTSNRAYIECINDIKNGATEGVRANALEALIRKIEHQHISHLKVKDPRKNLRVTKEFLIEALRSGIIPEYELWDFFSNWDPPAEEKRKWKAKRLSSVN